MNCTCANRKLHIGFGEQQRSAKYGQDLCSLHLGSTYRSGPSCSKLTMSLVNVLLKL